MPRPRRREGRCRGSAPHPDVLRLEPVGARFAWPCHDAWRPPLTDEDWRVSVPDAVDEAADDTRIVRPAGTDADAAGDPDLAHGGGRFGPGEVVERVTHE